MKHTPAPWIAKINKSEFGDSVITAEILDADGEEVCCLNYTDIMATDLPNAKLIATAPEMLEFILELNHLSKKELVEIPDILKAIMDKIITKATGGV